MLREESPEVESPLPSTLINRLKKSNRPVRKYGATSVLRSFTPTPTSYRSRYNIRSPSPVASSRSSFPVASSRSPSPVASSRYPSPIAPIDSSCSPSPDAFSRASTIYYTPEATTPPPPSSSSSSQFSDSYNGMYCINFFYISLYRL